MEFVPNPLLHASGVRIGAKNVGCPSAGFVGGRRAKPIFASSLGARIFAGFRARASNSPSSSQAEDERVKGDGGAAFLKMWEQAKQGKDAENEQQDWARRDEEFQSILQIPREERDKVQRMQVVDRAAAAVAAVNALLADYPTTEPHRQKAMPSSNAAAAFDAEPRYSTSGPKWIPTSVVEVRPEQLSRPGDTTAADEDSPSSGRTSLQGTPGPDFWSWVPPEHQDGRLQPLQSTVPDPKPVPPTLEKDRASSSLFIPFETEATKVNLPIVFQNRAMPSLPPLQSLLEVEKEKLAVTDLILEVQSSIRMPSVDTQTASAVNHTENLPSGVHDDGSRWWQETGVEYKKNGVVCRWTVIRGVSADERTEWEEKFWEASDAFDYKELGAEKSGRDSSGRVWHEFWKEAMWQDAVNGLQHMEKRADKWGKDAVGGQWREKWFEHYDALGYTEKWADKWSQIDSDRLLEPGHAHTWCERWGEIFDGQGGAMKYTDKWAERKENGDTWTKWGDKWDEHFDNQGHGVKQGETWWEGMNGERWNKTWGEGHNGTGWVHKYGKSSSGEHWDTHTQEDTWYERKPHFGFRECFDNSRELRRVNKQTKRQL